MYWPIGTPRLYRIAVLQPHPEAGRSNDEGQKSQTNEYHTNKGRSRSTHSEAESGAYVRGIDLTGQDMSLKRYNISIMPFA